MSRHPRLLLLALAALLTWPAAAVEPPVVAQAQPQEQRPGVPGATRSRASSQKPPLAQAAREEARPAWSELNPAQQQALRPLGATWKTLSEAHKRKWIALSENFARLPPQEQQLLHSRMSGWAALSPQQRTQARLNFADTKKVPTEDKKAMWEAYQALPPEEKRKLAAGAQAVKPPPPPTAAAVKPVPPQKMAKVPARKPGARSPGIAVAPGQVDQHTLLPQPGATPPPRN